MIYSQESPTSREHARTIFESLGRGNEFIEDADYYIATTEDGEEYLTCWGDDEPVASNRSTTSWMSPGKP